MKAVNLYQFMDSWKSLDSDIFNSYASYTGIGEAQKGVREAEMKDLERLLQCMIQNKVSVGMCDEFYINYSIPQIGKEFDLLRFGDDYILNIEIKHTGTIEKIEKQLIRNQYYLKFSGMALKQFTFIADRNELYQLIGNSIEKSNFEDLLWCIENQRIDYKIDPDAIFDPINFLVSPFNSTIRFMAGEYFLTKQQEEIKRSIMQSVDSQRMKFISITGEAGTGKTLLAYDIAKTSITCGKKVLILHCAQLNDGQQVLINDYGWEIVIAKNGVNRDLKEYDVIILDEAQRARLKQYETIVDKIKLSHAVCIFSHDRNQCLHNYEIRQDISSRIITSCDETFTLTNRIRTNKEITDFISRLFESRTIYNSKVFPNVSLSYCNNSDHAKRVLTHLAEMGWKTPIFTPGTRTRFHYEDYKVSGEDCAHAVIGQEYDNVVGVIDNFFYYDENRMLQSRNDEYYSLRLMLFQILTRARKQLHILVLNNPKVLKKCLEIIS